MLVVDDDTGLQETVAAALELEGYEPVVARNGLDALAKLEGMTPTFIVLELMMPRMDGFAFAAELARRGLRPAVPILVLSAHPRQADAAACIGAEAYLAKPFDLDDLFASVERLDPP